jgi:hypothetical protein
MLREFRTLKAENEKIGRRNVALRTRNQRLMKLMPVDYLLGTGQVTVSRKSRLELGEPLLDTEPDRARDLMRKCGLPRAKEPLTEPKFFAGRIGESGEPLKEWRP